MASHNNDDAPEQDQDQEEEEFLMESDEDEDDDDSYRDSNELDPDEDPNERDARILHGPKLLFLCQEQCFQQADRRFDLLVAQEKHSTLERELFQVNRDCSSSVMEMVAGYASRESLGKFLRYAIERHPDKLRHILSLQPQSGLRRTPLHGVCWSNHPTVDIYKLLIRACPEAMFLKDDANRTPADLLHRYHCGRPANYELEGAATEESRQRLAYLRRQAQRWTMHQIRDTLYLGAQRYFTTTQKALTPFCDKDRKTTKMMRRQWSIMSVLGSLIQREMTPLAWHILGFVNTNHTKKRKRNPKQGSNKRRKTKN